MGFARPKKREPLGEAGLFEYAVGALARRMRTERDLRRLMKARAEAGEAGVRAMDAVVVRLKELNYLSDTRFAEDYTRVRKEHEKFGQRRVQQDLMQKGVKRELVSSTLETAYEGVDEVTLAREYIARKRMKQPSGENAQKETARAMNRLLRAGFSSKAIYKVLREWELPAEALEGMETGAADAEVLAEAEERAGDSDTYARQNDREED
ncbi:MAG TPA: regulatory protein RecX [Edaphobacter sp.]|nr:regulatory protein RecX [Edaphobacter sp.]